MGLSVPSVHGCSSSVHVVRHTYRYLLHADTIRAPQCKAASLRISYGTLPYVGSSNMMCREKTNVLDSRVVQSSFRVTVLNRLPSSTPSEPVVMIQYHLLAWSAITPSVTGDSNMFRAPCIRLSCDSARDTDALRSPLRRLPLLQLFFRQLPQHVVPLLALRLL